MMSDQPVTRECEETGNRCCSKQSGKCYYVRYFEQQRKLQAVRDELLSTKKELDKAKLDIGILTKRAKVGVR